MILIKKDVRVKSQKKKKKVHSNYIVKCSSSHFIKQLSQFQHILWPTWSSRVLFSINKCVD